MAHRNRVQAPPKVFRPPRVYPVAEKVGLVDAAVPKAVHPSQPTTNDVLDAINDLSKKLSQISKNQQTLESRLDHIQTTVDNNYSNIISAAYLNLDMTMYINDIDHDNPTSYPNSPHWR